MTDVRVHAMKFHTLDLDSTLDHYCDSPRHVIQQKIDGIRGITVTTVEGVRVYGGGERDGEIASTTAAPVADRLRDVLQRLSRGLEAGQHITLDGELVRDRRRGDRYWVFDLLCDLGPTARVERYDPYDVRLEALLHWMTQMRAASPAVADLIHLVPTAADPAGKRRLLEAVRDVGGEGVIIKDLEGIYGAGDRVRHSLKYKFTRSIDCVVTARNTDRKGNPHPTKLNATLRVYRKDGTDYEVGQCSMIGKPDARPGDVVEVRYLYAGAGGRLVQPTLLRIRDDKAPEECTTEQLHFVSKKVVQP